MPSDVHNEPERQPTEQASISSDGHIPSVTYADGFTDVHMPTAATTNMHFFSH